VNGGECPLNLLLSFCRTALGTTWSNFTERQTTVTLNARRPDGVLMGRNGAMPKKILRWGGLAFLVFFIAYRPQSAANVVSSLGGGLLDIANGFGDFFASLGS
jgi:hypothetical protein